MISMRRSYRYAIIAIAMSGFLGGRVPAPVAHPDRIDAVLKNKVEQVALLAQPWVAGDRIHVRAVLRDFYQRREYRPAWTRNGRPLPQVDTLVGIIRECGSEGLKPTHYHLVKIEEMLAARRADRPMPEEFKITMLVDLDLLLTDAFVSYAWHLSGGRVERETSQRRRLAYRPVPDLAEILQDALGSDQLAAALGNLVPQQPGYRRLRTALALYRQLAASRDRQKVPDGSKMQKGDRGERVKILRARLLASGDFGPEPSRDDLFDEALERVVQTFQYRHGLEVDGVVGRASLSALNVSAEERLRQIELNMERWRWLPNDLGKRHILVNIANFELNVVEDNQIVMKMRIVAGMPHWRTPMFSDKIVTVVFNPYWNIPPRIVSQETLPAVRKDPEYFAKKNIKVLQGWGTELKEVDPSAIDWSKISAENLDYRFRQEPGPRNSLGRVRFSLEGLRDIHLHDTPVRDLFTKVMRAFSHGCMRIEKPLELVEYTLRDVPQWTRDNIEAAIDKHREQTVRLPEPMPIHALYWTAWVGDDGMIHFRNDIYKHDDQLARLLYERPIN